MLLDKPRRPGGLQAWLEDIKAVNPTPRVGDAVFIWGTLYEFISEVRVGIPTERWLKTWYSPKLYWHTHNHTELPYEKWFHGLNIHFNRIKKQRSFKDE